MERLVAILIRITVLVGATTLLISPHPGAYAQTSPPLQVYAPLMLNHSSFTYPGLATLAAPHGVARVGMMIGYSEHPNRYAVAIAADFNSITPGNALKFRHIHPCPPLAFTESGMADPALFNPEVRAWLFANQTTTRRDDPTNPYCDMNQAEDEWDFAPMDAMVLWAKANNVGVYGHTLIWDGMAQPGWMVYLDKYQATWLMQQHISTIIHRYCQPQYQREGESVVYAYDVVNEATTNTGGLAGQIWKQVGNRDTDPATSEFQEDTYVRQAFTLTAAALDDCADTYPDYADNYAAVQLVYNDKGAEISAVWAQGIYDMVRYLNDPDGNPTTLDPHLVDAVGYQMHIAIYPEFQSPLPPHFAELGTELYRVVHEINLDVHITEADVALRRFRGHPDCQGYDSGSSSDDCSLPAEAVMHWWDAPQDPFRSQAAVFGTLATLCRDTFSPATGKRCTVFTVWGLEDENSWLRCFSPQLFRRDPPTPCPVSTDILEAPATRGAYGGEIPPPLPQAIAKPAYAAVHASFAMSPTSNTPAGTLKPSRDGHGTPRTLLGGAPQERSRTSPDSLAGNAPEPPVRRRMRATMHGTHT